jgi:hypothetical protein
VAAWTVDHAKLKHLAHNSRLSPCHITVSAALAKPSSTMKLLFTLTLTLASSALTSSLVTTNPTTRVEHANTTAQGPVEPLKVLASTAIGSANSTAAESYIVGGTLARPGDFSK